MNSRTTTIEDCKLFKLPKLGNRSGNITPIQNHIDIPFEIKRIYYLYDVPGGETRGGHAHIELQQLIVAGSGSFDVNLHDGKNEKTVTLNSPDEGLLMPVGIWRDLSNFSSGSICLVLASHLYTEDDYIRSFDDFLNYKK